MRADVDEEPPQAAPQTTPQAVGFGAHDHSFTLQAIMDLKGSLAELKVSVQHVADRVDSMSKKVEDLVTWKNRILGGAVVIGAICTFAGFAIAKFGDYVTIRDPHVTQQAAAVTTPPSFAPANSPAPAAHQ